MSMADLERAFDLIAAHQEDADFAGPRDEQLIRLAEQALEVSFPPSYRRFLLQFGCGDIAGVEIYGLVDGNFSASTVPNGIWLSLKLRRTAKLPLSYVLISATGDGAYCALDTARRDESGESPVVLWSRGPGNKPEPISSDFGKFLLDEIASALEDSSQEIR